ncbi:hypothetical protein BHE90_002735 [Fusarium euwallaceae]|uniref:Uncharacterized protein n=1 Tax=Fusarium euwallaceae TaxID=1147111 RepID=A0A430M4D4_9HYPO|nr:hypothetical protein BHE90_002735 [Fusarium euwallaceae]
MASGTPTYHPAPNWDIPPSKNIVVPGRLITDPKNPESIVSNNSVVPIPQHEICEGEKSDWKTNLNQFRKHGVGFWATCRHIISAGLNSDHVQSTLESHTFDVLETKYFVANDNHRFQALNDAGVQNYFRTTNWKMPVYLITGIKIARGVCASTENSTGWSGQAKLKFDATSVGVPIDVGPDASWDSNNKRSISYSASTDFIFAYQVEEVMPKKGGRGFKAKRYVEGALYAHGEGGHDENANWEGGHYENANWEGRHDGVDYY